MINTYAVAIWLFFVSLSLHASHADFHLRHYSDVCIATDLEPDDVLALKLIFEEANSLYHDDPKRGYPIKLIIVGEGNTAIKRFRMKKLLKSYLHVPERVSIDVVAGRATENNIFPCDGRELCSKCHFPPFEDNDGKKAVKALKEFASETHHPFIIQIKPSQELFFFSFDKEFANKTSVLIYGSFNLRRTVLDEEVLDNKLFDPVRHGPFPPQLQLLLDHFAKSFEKMAIVESFGVLGPESAVYCKNPWTDDIGEKIDHSKRHFYPMFRALVLNWNQYLFSAEIKDLLARMKALTALLTEQPLKMQSHKITNMFKEVKESCSTHLFCEALERLTDLLQEIRATNPQPPLAALLAQIEESLPFTTQVSPAAGIQFALADVCVALATIDRDHLFHAPPVDIHVNDRGFLVPVENPDSSVFYYQRVPHEKFAEMLIPLLE